MKAIIAILIGSALVLEHGAIEAANSHGRQKNLKDGELEKISNSA